MDKIWLQLLDSDEAKRAYLRSALAKIADSHEEWIAPATHRLMESVAPHA